jgi:hypothetical protein
MRDRLMKLHQEKMEVALVNHQPLTLTEDELKDLCEFCNSFLYDSWPYNFGDEEEENEKELTCECDGALELTIDRALKDAIGDDDLAECVINAAKALANSI